MKRKLINYLKKYKIGAKFLGWLKLKKDMINGEYNNFLELVNTFSSSEYINNKKRLKKISKDAYFSHYFYKIELKEYFFFNFENLSDFGRKKYIGNIERNEILSKIGTKETIETLKNKYKCYCKFKEFYKRDIIKIIDKEDKNIFTEFCQKHYKFIVKPIDKSQGSGIYCVDLKREPIQNVWEKILNEATGGGFF